MFKILVCEEFISQNIYGFSANYDIDISVNGDDILEKTYSKKYDLYIINFVFYPFIEELKKFEDKTQTIFIDDYYDIYHIKKAFEVGDEYLIKPLNIEELKIRVKYFYKKLFSRKSNILSYKNLFFHISSKQLFQDNKKIKVSPNDIKLIEYFMSSKNIPLSKYDLLEEINSTSDGALRVYISKLKKIGFNIEFDRSINSYILI